MHFKMSLSNSSRTLTDQTGNQDAEHLYDYPRGKVKVYFLILAEPQLVHDRLPGLSVAGGVTRFTMIIQVNPDRRSGNFIFFCALRIESCYLTS